MASPKGIVVFVLPFDLILLLISFELGSFTVFMVLVVPGSFLQATFKYFTSVTSSVTFYGKPA